MAVLQEFKCPCCDGSIGFDSSSQKMKCPYCDTEFEVASLLELDEALKAEWVESRGITVAKIALNPITLNPEDMKKIQEMEDSAS